MRQDMERSQEVYYYFFSDHTDKCFEGGENIYSLPPEKSEYQGCLNYQREQFHVED